MENGTGREALDAAAAQPSHTSHRARLNAWSIAAALAVALVLLVASTWFLRERMSGLAKPAKPLIDFTQAGSGFEWINQQIISATTGTASALRRTQTGSLSWNVMGIAGGLILLLALIVWRG